MDAWAVRALVPTLLARVPGEGKARLGYVCLSDSCIPAAVSPFSASLKPGQLAPLECAVPVLC